MRININIDDHLKLLSEQKAKSMGLTLSSLVRLLLSKETQDFREKVDQLVIDTEKEGYDNPIQWTDYKKQLQKDLNNVNR